MIVVLPVAESPTTPRMMGRAMCSSPYLSRRRGREDSARRQCRRVGAGPAQRAGNRPRHIAAAPASNASVPSSASAIRCAPSLANDARLPQREVAAVVVVARAGSPIAASNELRVSSGSSRTWRTICGPSVPGWRSRSCAPAGASTAGSDITKPSANSAAAMRIRARVLADPRAERDEQHRDARDHEPRAPAPAAHPRAPRRGEHERRREQRREQHGARPPPAPQGRRARTARARSRARTGRSTSPARTAARARPRAAAS